MPTMYMALGSALVHVGFCYVFVIVFDLGLKGAADALTLTWIVGKKEFCLDRNFLLLFCRRVYYDYFLCAHERAS